MEGDLPTLLRTLIGSGAFFGCGDICGTIERPGCGEMCRMNLQCFFGKITGVVSKDL